jgi:hypothetical protein
MDELKASLYGDEWYGKLLKMVKWKELGRKWSCRVSRYYIRVRLENTQYKTNNVTEDSWSLTEIWTDHIENESQTLYLTKTIMFCFIREHLPDLKNAMITKVGETLIWINGM